MVKSLKERKGKYGLAKYRAFASLEGREWVNSRELVILSGLRYHSISRLLPRWLEWQYVDRQLSLQFGAGTFQYKLTARGRGWLEAARKDLPAAGQFAAELAEWQSRILPVLPQLMAGQFKDVLAALDGKIPQPAKKSCRKLKIAPKTIDNV